MQSKSTHLFVWFEDHIPVVEASLQVHHSLLGEPRSKHVLTVDLAPQVPVILGVVTN